VTDQGLVQANHHVAKRFSKNNGKLPDPEGDEPEFSLEGSSRRAQILGDALASLGASCSLDNLVQPLNSAAVLNRYTCQQMVFCPGTGNVVVTRKVQS
jgi:hypothetical protein